MTEPKAPRKGPSADELLRRWEADKKKSLVFLQLAEEYRRQDAVDAALSVLREGLKVHPNSQAAHVQLARCLMAKRELAEAQGELERIRTKHPDNILAGKLLAEVLEERNQGAAALKILKALVPFAPDDDEIGARIARLGGSAAAAPPPAPATAPATGPMKVSLAPDDTSEFLTGEFEVGRMGAPAIPTPSAPPAPPAAWPVGARSEDTGSSDTTSGTTGELSVTTGERRLPSFPPPLAPAPAPVEAEEEPAVVDLTEEDEAQAPATLAIPARAPVPADLLGPSRRETRVEPQGEEDDFTSLTLAELYESQSAHAEALALYEKLAARRPNDPEIRHAVERCRAALSGADLASRVVEAVASPPPSLAKPRWAPVRPVAPAAPPPAAVAPAPPEPLPPPTPAPAAAVAPAKPGAGAAPLRSAPGAPSKAAADASRETLRAARGELQRWLAAARAVRQ